jgi:hypothetical protein
MLNFKHHFVTNCDLPENGYLVASNGVFLRASREGLDFALPLALTQFSSPLLKPLNPSIHLKSGKLTIAQMEAIDDHFLACYPNEAIAWVDTEGNLTFPPLLEATPSTCLPKPSALYPQILVEIHSHGRHHPVFSHTDDIEQTGFRLYGVFSYRTGNPLVNFRLGYHQQFWSVPAAAVAELPDNFQDFYLK